MNKSTETPKRTEALLDAYKAEEEVKTVLDPKAIKKSTLESLPTPTGYRLLVLPYAGPKKTKGGILSVNGPYLVNGPCVPKEFSILALCSIFFFIAVRSGLIVIRNFV